MNYKVNIRMRFQNLLAVLFFLLIICSKGTAQIIQIASEEDVAIETTHPYSSSQNGLSQVVFEENFYSQDASYIKLHFKDFNLANGDYVSITSPENNQEIIYNGNGKKILNGTQSISDFWSLSIFSNNATVKLYSTGNTTGYGFLIDKVAYGYPEAQIQQSIYEAICGNDDKEEIACYNGTPMFDKGMAVCRLVIGGGSLCTGWLLGTDGHVMTNNHCVGSQTAANNVEFQFNYQYTNCSGTSTASTDVVAQSSVLMCTDSDLDYTLLQLPVNPTNTYGFLSMRSSGPVVGERIYIPQHPGGSRKKISVNDDQSNSGFAQVVNINGGVNGTRVEYYSDTEGGSSGSPVLSYNDHLVVSLHNTGGCLNGSNRVDAIIADMGSCLPNGGIDNPGNIVIADFETNTSKSCDGNIQFNNLSYNDVNRMWRFGDGVASNQDNPSHTYNNSGTYTVQLIVEDSIGTKDTAYQIVNVAIVNSPVIGNDSICGSGIGNLSANSSGNTIYWYDVPSGGSSIHSGNTFTTPQISSTTTYYVEAEENTPTQNVGPVDNNIGGGQLFTANDNWGCYFDVEKPLTINSVKVYAGNGGNRLIELLQNGNLVDSKTINIPSGESRINLDFEVNPGTQYLLKVSGGTIDLFRNNGGANYPYSIQGLISITGNNTTSGTSDDYYYYFYDWEVKEVPCISNRVPVVAFVSNPPTLTANITDADCQGGASGAIDVSISPNNPGTTYNWSNGEITQDLTNVLAGTYTLTAISGDCQSVQSFTVNSSGQAAQLSAIAQDETCDGLNNGSIILSINNSTPNPSISWSNGATTQNLSNLSPGSYSVTVGAGSGCAASTSVTIGVGGTYPTISASINDISCNGLVDGNIQIQLNDTTSPVGINWSNGASGTVLNNLISGIYTVSITNGNGCNTSSSFTIDEPDSLEIDILVDTTQSNNCNAIAYTNISGGTPGYSLQWNDPSLQTTDTAYGLCPGQFSLRVTDVNGCSLLKQFEVDSSSTSSNPINTNLEEADLLSEINFYPIPAKDYIIVELPDQLKDKKVEIRLQTIIGQQFFKAVYSSVQDVYKIDLSKAVPGTYILGVQIEEKIYWKKVLVL